MKTLSPTQRDRAHNFMTTRADSLAQALYAYHFGTGTAAPVLAELARYQNEDGGFGYGLEPDVQSPSSSVLATTVALQMLQAIRVSGNEPLVQAAMRYLLATYDASTQCWRIVTPAIQGAPHAPWWEAEGLTERFNHFWLNPRAEIVGYLHQYADLVPAALRAELTEAVITTLHTLPDQMEMHDLLCAIRLVETDALPTAARQAMLPKLRRVVDTVVAREPAEWRQYGLPPLAVVHTPDSLFADLFNGVLAQNLDFLIESQAADGSWTPNWSWEETYPKAWPAARRAWQGRLTLEALLQLRAFGRF